MPVPGTTCTCNEKLELCRVQSTQLVDHLLDGGPDKLTKVKGIGPKLQELLFSMGFFHFDQIASWDASQVAWVDENLDGFKGRASRDDWVAQACSLSGLNVGGVE